MEGEAIALDRHSPVDEGDVDLHGLTGAQSDRQVRLEVRDPRSSERGHRQPLELGVRSVAGAAQQRPDGLAPPASGVPRERPLELDLPYDVQLPGPVDERDAAPWTLALVDGGGAEDRPRSAHDRHVATHGLVPRVDEGLHDPDPRLAAASVGRRERPARWRVAHDTPPPGCTLVGEERRRPEPERRCPERGLRRRRRGVQAVHPWPHAQPFTRAQETVDLTWAQPALERLVTGDGPGLAEEVAAHGVVHTCVLVRDTRSRPVTRPAGENSSA